MADYAPPPGPPPPKDVPEGYKAIWNAQYSEWFFVNIYTKESTWTKPTKPVYPPGEGPPEGPPPGYSGGSANDSLLADKKNLSSNNPYASGHPTGTSPQPDISEDEKLARKLQEEERAKADTRGAANDFYAQGTPTPQPNIYGGGGGYPAQGSSGYAQQGSSSPYPQGQGSFSDQGAPLDKGKSKGGLLGKLLGKHSSSSQQPQYQQQHGYPQQQYGPPGGGYYGGQPQGYYPQQGYGQPQKKHGMGAGGAAALGVGGGLLGGALIGGALADAGDGGDYGGDGGDYGGGDGGGDYGGDGGGDFGGDGGGDFGGGDF